MYGTALLTRVENVPEYADIQIQILVFISKKGIFWMRLPKGFFIVMMAPKTASVV
jgi:hypothetical protein